MLRFTNCALSLVVFICTEFYIFLQSHYFEISYILHFIPFIHCPECKYNSLFPEPFFFFALSRILIQNNLFLVKTIQKYLFQLINQCVSLRLKLMCKLFRNEVGYFFPKIEKKNKYCFLFRLFQNILLLCGLIIIIHRKRNTACDAENFVLGAFLMA